MTTTCTKAIHSIRTCARLNLQQARTARADNRPRMACHYLKMALQCRADANALASSAR